MSDMEYNTGTVTPRVTQPVRFQSDANGNLKTAATTTPSVVGAGTAAAAARVTLASDDPAVTAIGAVADAAVTNPASSASLVAALKGLLTRLGFTLTAASGVASAALRTVNSTDDPVIGATNETAPASDTATSGLNGRLQRIAQRLTSLLVQGTGAASAGQRVVTADDTGATTTSRITSAAGSTNATSAKAPAGTLYAVRGYNAAAAGRYIKLYNKASAPTVGTDTPVLTLVVGATQAFNFEWSLGRYFSTGIAYAMTVNNGDADTTALTAGDILGLNVEYR